MTIGKEILIRRTSGHESAWCHALKGDIWHLCLSGVQYSPALRGSGAPQIRLLENQKDPLTRCELVTDWPDAPPEWPVPEKPVAPQAGARR